MSVTMIRPLRRPLLIAALLLTAACPTSIPNPQHCWNANGDATCQANSGNALPYCSHGASPCHAEGNLGCVAERPDLDECYSPCGGGMSILESDQCEGIADESGTGSVESSSTDSQSSGSESPDTTTPESDSTGTDDCDSSCRAPLFCHDGLCVECTPDDQQACAATESWCDPRIFTCQPCTTHFQCPGGAGCHLELGTCLPSDRVYDVFVDGLSFVDALLMLGDQDGTIRVHDDSTYPLESTFQLAPDQVVAVVAIDEARPTIARIDAGVQAEFAFELDWGCLYLWGLRLSGDAGVVVLGSGKLHAEKTAFDHVHAAVQLTGGHAEIRNCMLIGDNVSGWSTLGIGGGGSVNVTFSTILARVGDNALVCNPGEVAVRNSVIGSFDEVNGIDVFNCSYFLLDTAVEEVLDGVVVNPAEAVVGDFSPADFMNVDAGDLHIVPSDMFDGIAQWSSSDPLDDIDGDLRVTNEKTWPGADHPQ
jgi:hypothetical protein